MFSAPHLFDVRTNWSTVEESNLGFRITGAASSALDQQCLETYLFIAGAAGFEPAIRLRDVWVTARCRTGLSRTPAMNRILEGNRGIQPRLPRSKRGVLCIRLVAQKLGVPARTRIAITGFVDPDPVQLDDRHEIGRQPQNRTVIRWV